MPSADFRINPIQEFAPFPTLQIAPQPILQLQQPLNLPGQVVNAALPVLAAIPAMNEIPLNPQINPNLSINWIDEGVDRLKYLARDTAIGIVGGLSIYGASQAYGGSVSTENSETIISEVPMLGLSAAVICVGAPVAITGLMVASAATLLLAGEVRQDIRQGRPATEAITNAAMAIFHMAEAFAGEAIAASPGYIGPLIASPLISAGVAVAAASVFGASLGAAAGLGTYIKLTHRMINSFSIQE